MNKKILKSEIIIIIVAIMLFLIPNLIGKTTIINDANKVSTKTFDDIKKNNLVIGCLLGTSLGEVLKEKFPNAEIQLFNTNEDVYQAVDSGVVDYGIGYLETIDRVTKTYDNMKYIKEPIYITENCFVLPKTEKGNKQLKQFDDYLNSIVTDGTYKKLEEKWQSKKESNYHIEKYNLSGKNGVLQVVTGGTWVPNTFIFDGEVVGLFIDMIYGFCEKYGYIPEISTAAYQAELAGISASKYDIMADIAEKTSEREKTVLLTKPIIESVNVVITHEVSKETVIVDKKDVFFKKIKNGFEKNFIVDKRWQLIVHGLIVTIALALFSAFFGTILGGIICALRMSKNTYMTAFARIYIKLIQSTPIVVSLMLFYYLIFNGLNFSAFIVSIIAFSIDFSAYAAEIFRSGIEAIPIGQVKAAKALGFTKKQIYSLIVIPQAIIHILPVYSGQFISMVKLTSVAGYISVTDLTKMSDYIRSLTYEAFFPLITTAIIYFILSTSLVRLLKFFENKIDFEIHRKKVMMEVQQL